MYKNIFKRVLDLILAILLFPIFLIVFLIIGPIIYIQDKGPIFYNASRLGRSGSIFTMYKFRSMKYNAPDLRNNDGSTFNSEDDPRVTKIGKFIRKTSVDEIPQILNILRGDMSFVGPRPDLPEHIYLYEGKENRKLEVKPGITGFNQAYFRNSIPWKQRIENDIYYIDNLTFFLDLKIIIKTIVSVIKRDDIYVKENTEGS